MSNKETQGDHGLPMLGNSHLIICRYGSLLDGIRSIAFLAKGLAYFSVCPLSFGRDIHSRIIFRRVSCSRLMLNPSLSTVVDGSISSASGASGHSVLPSLILRAPVFPHTWD